MQDRYAPINLGPGSEVFPLPGRPEVIAALSLSTDSSLKEVMACIEANQRGLALVTDGNRRLLATITDGDVRRGLLKGLNLDARVSDLLASRRKNELFGHPVTAGLKQDRKSLLAIMRRTRVQQLPLLDEEGCLADVVNLKELLSEIDVPFEPDMSSVLCPPTATLREILVCIDANQRGIALIVDQSNRLHATVTDGDIRRALLTQVDLETPVSQIIKGNGNKSPVTAPAETSRGELLAIMKRTEVRQLPLLDNQGRVVDLAVLGELLPDKSPDLGAVIMAGGFGTRLHPLTKDTPKPLLPIGEQSIIERIIGQLRRSGIDHMKITTHYMAEKIYKKIGDGSCLGVSLDYIEEDQPLGTAGALSLLESPQKPFLVINGDILTTVDFRAMFDYHREHDAALTVATRQYAFNVPYGVLETEGFHVFGLVEKPKVKCFVNAGIYIVEPSVLDFIPRGRRFDMTDLIQALIRAERNVVNFPIMEYWIDVGSHESYRQAQKDLTDNRLESKSSFRGAGGLSDGLDNSPEATMLFSPHRGSGAESL